jgi:membrane fusion protein (multidrug efflux system)
VRGEALLAPQQGIARDPKGNATALVVDGEGKVALRQVKVSQAIGDKWLVEQGLAAGDRLIVEGLQKIRPGMPVQAAEAGTAAAQPALPATAK